MSGRSLTACKFWTKYGILPSTNGKVTPTVTCLVKLFTTFIELLFKLGGKISYISHSISM